MTKVFASALAKQVLSQAAEWQAKAFCTLFARSATLLAEAVVGGTLVAACIGLLSPMSLLQGAGLLSKLEQKILLGSYTMSNPLCTTMALQSLFFMVF